MYSHSLTINLSNFLNTLFSPSHHSHGLERVKSAGNNLIGQTRAIVLEII